VEENGLPAIVHTAGAVPLQLTLLLYQYRNPPVRFHYSSKFVKLQNWGPN